GYCSDGANDPDVTADICRVGCFGIGLALGSFALHVVVSKLNEVVIAAIFEGFVPCAFVDEALGTAAVQRLVDAGYVRRHDGTETFTPAAFGIDGRIAYQHNLHRATLDDLHRLHAFGRQRRGV